MVGQISGDSETKKNSASNSSPTNGTGGGAGEVAGLLEQAVEDPLVKFFEKNWRVLSVCVAVVLLGILARDAYRANFESTMQQAADVFGFTRKEYAALVELEKQINAAESGRSEGEEPSDELKQLGQSRDEALKRLKGNLIALSGEREPYRSFATFYSGLVSATTGDREVALTTFKSLDWRSKGDGSLLRMIGELAALNSARILIDGGDQERLQGLAILEELASSASYARVSAALTLSRLAESDVDKQKVVSLLEGVQSDHPEQSDLLTGEIERLRPSL